jgi:hypothetical protein
MEQLKALYRQTDVGLTEWMARRAVTLLRCFVEQLMTSRLGNPTLGPGTAVANGHCEP